MSANRRRTFPFDPSKNRLTNIAWCLVKFKVVGSPMPKPHVLYILHRLTGREDIVFAAR